MTTLRESLAASPVLFPRPRTRSRVAAEATAPVVGQRAQLRGFLICLGGFIGLLCAMLMALNVYLVHGTFTLQQLQRQSQTLERAQQAAGDRVAAAESPARLAQVAGRLGMRPAESPVFLPLSGSDAHRQVGVSVRH